MIARCDNRVGKPTVVSTMVLAIACLLFHAASAASVLWAASQARETRRGHGRLLQRGEPRDPLARHSRALRYSDRCPRYRARPPRIAEPRTPLSILALHALADGGEGFANRPDLA